MASCRLSNWFGLQCNWPERNGTLCDGFPCSFFETSDAAVLVDPDYIL